MDRKASVTTKSDGKTTDLSSRVALDLGEKKLLKPSITTRTRHLGYKKKTRVTRKFLKNAISTTYCLLIAAFLSSSNKTAIQLVAYFALFSPKSINSLKGAPSAVISLLLQV